MKLSQVFQYSIYIQVLQSSLIYGLAEEAVFPQGLTLPIALFCLYVIDTKDSLKVPQWLADGLGLIAFFFAGLEFFSDRPAAKLLAGSHLLIYLTWVVLIQEKSIQQYWRLIALATLQVAVAAVLTSEPQFGLLLVMYVFFSLWTLSVYSMYRAELRFAQAERAASPQLAEVATSPSGIRPTQDTVSSGEKRESLSATGFAFSRSSTRGTIQHDPDQRWINSRFVLGTFATANMSIVVGTVFFMLIPRLWFGRWSALADTPLAGGRTSITGYNEEVELGSTGEIQESSQLVMRVKLTRLSDNSPISVEEYTERLGFSEPMFRGSVLSEYRDARWTREMSRNSSGVFEQSVEFSEIGQEYRLEPIGSRVLFYIPPVEAGSLTNSNSRILHNQRTGVVFHPGAELPTDAMHYRMYSGWPAVPVRGRPAEAISESATEAIFNRLSPIRQRNLWRVYLQIPPELNRLEELARRVAYDGRPPSEVPPNVRADRLEEFLRDSGEYTYSLKSNVVNGSDDPVEDFLFNRKEGDCKYYATALAMMLRAVDVPSRVINGFKGGVLDEETGEFFVQQRHAHTWVEALIVDRPPDAALPRLNWITYDATPATRDAEVNAMTDETGIWEAITKTAGDIWTQYIVQMSLTRQTQDIYVPIQTSVREWWQGAGGARGVLARTGSGLVHFFRNPDQWVSWKGGLIAFCLMVSLVAAFRVGHRVWRRIHRFWNRTSKRRHAQTIRIEFYEKFLALMARYGWNRSPAQTQHEFAEEFVAEFERRFPDQTIGDLPRSITTSFYHCRFGLQPLSDDEIRTMERNLTQLEHVLSQPTNGNGKR